jgi:hypothetical protein
MADLPAGQPVAESLFGREDLAAQFWNGVQEGRRHFGFEGPTGIGKTAFLQATESALRAAGFSVARLNAAEQANEELAIAAIYLQLKDLAQDPEAVIQSLRQRFSHEIPRSLRKVAAAAAADLIKLVTDKAENTIDAIREIAGGEDNGDGAADQMEALSESNRRLFLTKFLQALLDAGNKVAISIDNLDLADLTSFTRYALSVPANVTILAAHNTERTDNAAWDLIAADIEGYAGRVWAIETLDRPAVASWARAILDVEPSDAFIEEVMGATRGRPHDIRMILEAERDGAERPPQREFRRYYAIKREKLDARGRAVADLLAVLPHDKSIAIERLSVAAAALDVPDTTPSLDHMRRLRLIKQTASGIALAHSIAQDFWCEDITKARRNAIIEAWYNAFADADLSELTAGAAVAMLPVIAPNLLEAKSDEEISAIGVRLVEIGQIEIGLKFLDRSWRFGQRQQGEESLQHALLAAQTRLQLGRYQDVDEPLTQADLAAKTPQDRLAVLLVRMKLALRRNAYEVLWKTYADVEAIALGDVHAQAETQSTLNVAYRDLLNYHGIRATSERLQSLRRELDEKSRLSVDRTLARAFAKLGDMKPALQYAESAMVLAMEVGSARDLGNAYLARAEVHRYRKCYADAVADYGRAAEIARGTANRDSLLWSLLGGAAAFLEAREGDRVPSLFQELHLLLNQPGYEHPLETAHLALLQALAGVPTEPIQQTVDRYLRLGVEWPARLLRDFNDSGRIDGPTPL